MGLDEGPTQGRGILYHYNPPGAGPSYRHEFQIHEGDVGSYWARHTILDVPARPTTDLPEAIRQARPYLAPLVSTLADEMLLFDPDAAPHHFAGREEWQIVIAHPENEKPAGEWNTLELICFENHAIHVVNGEVNMVVLDARIRDGDREVPITSGSIQLQSEGAELFFKDLEIRRLSRVPEAYARYLPSRD